MSVSHPDILVAAEPTLYRTGLITLLQQQWPTLYLTLTADTSQLVDFIRVQPFQLLILDGNLLGRTISTLLSHLRQVRPSQRILLLATEHQSHLASPPQLLVPQHISPNRLTDALSPWLNAKHCQTPTKPSSVCLLPTQFSRRELEVLRLVVEDLCNQQIADRLYLSVRTVESHRRALLQKSGTRTLVGLVAWALRTGMIA